MTDPEAPAAPEPAPPPRRGWRTRTKVILAAVLLSPLLIFGLYTLLVLKWSYSDGYRAGILQKFSRKGYVCKTWEGELAMSSVPGVAPTIWQFSVRDDSVARQLVDAMGESSSRVRLHYTEHRGVPSECFGATNYFVDSVQLVR
jgi:hypothetical protein